MRLQRARIEPIDVLHMHTINNDCTYPEAGRSI